MDLDSYLIDQVLNGKVVLFLGAGASMDAVDSKGNHAPSGLGLRDLIADKFLGGKYKNAPLDQVGDLAISVSDQTTVQEYVRSLYQDLQPSVAQLLLPSFVWAGLATTNYDRLVERSYEVVSKKTQSIVPFIENGDRVEDLLRDRTGLALLKLHGCITRTGPNSCPLVLSTDVSVK